ncbi:MAG: hypothetical protein R3330_13655, partial [Saprospiraceae bacterium]|nr:hypothetical protein [Saprospiraceae bacterium]
IVLGAGFWQNGSSTIFRRVWQGLRVYPTGINGYVDVRDVAYMALLRLERDLGPERMIISAANLSYQDLFTRIAGLMHRPPPRLRVSPILSEIAWRLLKPVGWITGREPMITRESARTTQCPLHFDNTRSRSVPGFMYTPLDRTLADIVQIIRNSPDNSYHPHTLPFLEHHLVDHSISRA